MNDEDLDCAINNIHFTYGDGRFEPGSYAYDKDGVFYYIGVGDRGGIIEEFKSENIDDILYKIYSEATFNSAIKYAMVNKEKKQDWRRILFSRQLDMLKCISEEYYNKRFDEIQNILEASPYRDNS